jgi:hypothetical protein
MITRGLAALILTFIFSTTLFAEYLYKDEVVHNPDFSNEINGIGAELYKKTGIALYLVMVRDLEDNQSIVNYEIELMKELEKPAVLLTFVELKKQVDILVRGNDITETESLYKDFDKKQILSPSATFIGAVVSAVMFGRSLDDYKEIFGNYGGTILPVLAEKAKGKDIVEKYSVAMYNGYTDIADQIADSKGVELSSSAGNGSAYFIDFLRLLFYGIILWAFYKYFRIKFFSKRKNEKTDS